MNDSFFSIISMEIIIKKWNGIFKEQIKIRLNKQFRENSRRWKKKQTKQQNVSLKRHCTYSVVKIREQNLCMFNWYYRKYSGYDTRGGVEQHGENRHLKHEK